MIIPEDPVEHDGIPETSYLLGGEDYLLGGEEMRSHPLNPIYP